MTKQNVVDRWKSGELSQLACQVKTMFSSRDFTHWRKVFGKKGQYNDLPASYDLRGFDFTGMHIKDGSVLSYCDLSFALFDNCVIDDFWFQFGNMCHNTFRDISVSGDDILWAQSSLSHVKFINVKFVNVCFEICTFDNVEFIECTFSRVRFQGTKLTNTIFSDKDKSNWNLKFS